MKYGLSATFIVSRLAVSSNVDELPSHDLKARRVVVSGQALALALLTAPLALLTVWAVPGILVAGGAALFALNQSLRRYFDSCEALADMHILSIFSAFGYEPQQISDYPRIGNELRPFLNQGFVEPAKNAAHGAEDSRAA